jgi:hypothetical protein
MDHFPAALYTLHIALKKRGYHAHPTRTAPKKFLFQLRSVDNEFGVSEDTFARLMAELSLNQTELVHKALRNLAKEVLPHTNRTMAR